MWLPLGGVGGGAPIFFCLDKRKPLRPVKRKPLRRKTAPLAPFLLKTWGPSKRHWAENFQSKRWARVRPCRIFQSSARDRELRGRGAKPIWLTSPSAAAPSISRAALSEAGGRARPPPVAEKGRARSGSNRERRAGGLPHALHDHVATGARKEKQCHATTTPKAAPHHQMRGSTISVPQG